MPTYRNPHQAIGRVYRVGLKSNPRVRFIYGKEAAETRILDTLARMKPVMEKLCPNKKRTTIFFPANIQKRLN